MLYLVELKKIEFIKPSNKKIKEMIKAQTRISKPFKIGHTDIKRKTMKKIIQKLLFELIKLVLLLIIR